MSNPYEDEDWLSPAAASATLRRSERQIREYARQKRIRTRRRGTRVEYAASDVRQLAAELQVDRDPPRAESVEIVPAIDLARRVDVLTDALRQAEQRAAAAETALRLLPSPDEARQLRDVAKDAQIEAAELRAEVSALKGALGQAQGGEQRAWRAAGILLATVLLLALALALLGFLLR